MKPRITESALRHIYTRHRDLVEALQLKSIDELREAIEEILEKPDEVHTDKWDSGIKYYLKRLDEHWVNVVVVKDEVKTAFIINQKSYSRFRRKRWL